jgi:hypothetical protein
MNIRKILKREGRRAEWLKRIGIAGFLFFLIKGIIWIGVALFVWLGISN